MKGIEEEINACYLTPVGARLVVKRDGFKYSGRLVIPDKAKQMPTTGVVVATGEGLESYLGKRILWNFLSGSPVTFRNRPAYQILNIEEVQAIVDTTEDLEPETQDTSQMY